LRPSRVTLKVILPSSIFRPRQPEESPQGRTVKRPRTPGPLLLNARSGLMIERWVNRRIWTRGVAIAICLAGLGALLLAGVSSAAVSTVSLTKTNNANHTGTFSSTETIPSTATYPWTVTYRLSIFGGTTPGPLGAFHTITSITDSNTTNIGTTCAGLIGTRINDGQTVTCTYTVTLSGPHLTPLVNTATLKFDNAPGDIKTSSSTVNFAPLTVAGGDFVIGNLNAAIGTHVTFWGAQWWKLNSLTGGSAPAAFKGFEDTPPSPTCGQTWTTDPGNSTPPPPGPLPPYIVIIVSSSITKSGSTISGDVQHLVLVKTNPGYASNPGHAGTGTVASQIC
jgi:hypothetical protein